MKSFVRNNIRRWLILARGKFSPPRTEGVNRDMRCLIFSLPLRDVPFLRDVSSLWNLLLFLLVLLAVPACKQPTAPDPKPEFSFTIEDASCTEAWLNVKTANFGSGFSFALNRNDSTIWRFTALPPDTIIVDEGLLPNKEYTYELLAISSKTAPVSAGKKKVTTMDTTSHNFTWQTWEFGDIGSSVLYDVAIIDENNIWAVGEISIRDSSHNGYTTYNAVHWDGVEWELKKIQFYTFCGQQHTDSYPAKSIYAFGPNDVWIGMYGSQVVKWNGQNQSSPICTPVSINKLWGTSSSDLYAVGNSGNIAHYDGVSWKKIESGTDMDFYHISGFKHPKTQKMEILLVCCDFMANRRGLYSMENKTLKWLSTSPASWDLLSVWFIPDRHYYLVGSGIYDKIRLSEKQWRGEILGITRYNTNEIFGNALNDIFVVGDFGEVLYFNGIRWKSYMEKLGKLSGAYGGVRMHKNIVVIVGFNDRKATILFGKR